MNAPYLQLLGLVAPVYLIIVAGFGARRLRWLSEEADTSLLRLVVNLLIPCLTLDSILGNPALTHSENILLPPIVGFFTIILGFGVALAAARLLRGSDTRQRRTFAFTTGIYNYGYLALPLVISLFDRRTLGVLFTHNLGVEIAFWTVGIIVLTGSSLRGGWRHILNPPVLAILLALFLNALRAANWLPAFILSGVHLIGGIAIPLALLLTGATVADWIGSLKTDHRPGLMTLACVLRLGVLPLLFLCLARWLPASVELKRIIVIQAAMPAGMLPVVIARHYGGDAGAALQVVLVTSAVGLLTIPFWIRFGMVFAGL